MAALTVQLRSVSGTKAALGFAGGHCLTVDRPDGRAGGKGLGFNGGELLALAVGGCFCNDLQYVAHEMGIELTMIAVDVRLELDGAPLLATSADLKVEVASADGDDDLAALIQRAREVSTVSNSLERGLRVTMSGAG
ncbi:OsmC-like protein [bacterium YEK0313]|nr:OsmC-like protein [bacterium YEK0313]